MTYYNMVRDILGVDVRARSSNKAYGNIDYDPFKSPIIHKQINGKEIVPLDLTKLWGK